MFKQTLHFSGVENFARASEAYRTLQSLTLLLFRIKGCAPPCWKLLTV